MSVKQQTEYHVVTVLMVIIAFLALAVSTELALGLDLGAFAGRTASEVT